MKKFKDKPDNFNIFTLFGVTKARSIKNLDYKNNSIILCRDVAILKKLHMFDFETLPVSFISKPKL